MSRHPDDELLEAYRHGALEQAGTSRIRGHLEACRLCRERLAEEVRFDRLLARGLPRLEAPANLRERLASALAAGAARRRAEG